ncbi:MAG: YkgJ family cysteine cluster protein [Dehalococcoidales bacterium]|nr:YkgJ family cysteine cluster protein [Dehalococcoidales bacterium]
MPIIAGGLFCAMKGDMTVYPCFCCGICCTGYQAHLDLAEAQAVADHLGVSLQKFLDEYTDPRWPGVATHLLLHKAGKCVFLDQKEGNPIGLCRIHDFKPVACRQWSASLNKKECRQGLSRYWGLSVDDSGDIVGSTEELKVFQTFIKML